MNHVDDVRSSMGSMCDLLLSDFQNFLAKNPSMQFGDERDISTSISVASNTVGPTCTI